MHRSGTSLAAALVCAAGVDAPKHLIPADQYNETGYWEPIGLNRLDDELLGALGLTWHTPTSFPSGVMRSAKAKRFVEKYVAVIQEEYGDSGLFCIKDPRLCRVLPVLLSAFDAMDIESSYVIQSRNPLDVAESLKHRDGFHPSLSFMLWLRHMLDAETYTRGKARVFVTYDQLLRDWRGVLTRIGDRLDLSWPRPAAAIDVEFERIISSGLRHHYAAADQLPKRADVPDWIALARSALLDASEDRGDPAGAFDAIRRDLENADKAFEPIVFIEQEKQGAAERVLADVRSQVQASENEALSAHAHVTHLEEHIASLTDRFESTESELESARVSAGERNAAIEELERRIDTLAAQAQSSQEHVQSLESELTAAEGALQSARDAASESDTALETLKTRLANDEVKAAFLERRSASLGAQLVASKSELDSIRLRVSEGDEALGEARARAVEMEAELESAGRHVKHLEQHITGLQEKYDATQVELEALRAKVIEREVELGVTRQELPRLKSSSEEALARVKELERYATAIQQKLDASSTELETARAQAMERELELAVSRQELPRLKTSIGEASARVIEFERRIASMNEKLEASQAELEASQAQVVEREAELTVARRELDTGREELHRLKTSSAEARARITELEREEARYRAELANRQRDVADRDRLAAERELAVKKQAAELEAAAKSIALHESELARLKKELDSRESACSDLQKALTSSETSAKEYRAGVERQLSARLDENVKARVALGAAEAEVAVITAKIAQLNVEVELERESHVDRQNDLRKARGELERLQDAISSRDSRLEELCAKLVAVQGALDAAQMELRSEREAFVLAQRRSPLDAPAQTAPQSGNPRAGVERPAETLDRYQRISAALERRGHERRGYFEEHDVLPIRIDNHREALATLRFDVVSQPVVDVLIPCFNEFETTVECLTALKAAKIGVPYRVILSDDGSTDERMTSFRSVEGLTFLASDQNRNFLLNCNDAYRSVRAPYLLLLNNDAQVEPGCVERLVDAIERESDAVAAGPMMLYPNGRLQEAGCSIRADASTIMVGVGENPDEPHYNYSREVQYVSGACCMVKTAAIGETLFDTQYAPAYCEDVDLCLRLRDSGGRIFYEPRARAVHHLSVSTGRIGQTRRVQQAVLNQEKLFQKWSDRLALENRARVLAFYLPQFHPIVENDLWWGRGFTEWTNVTDAAPSFDGHYQPHLPADLGYYDLRLTAVMGQQQALAERYGIEGFVVYYYNFAGRRVLEAPLENLLHRPDVNFRFALCWANENWTKHWDGGSREVLLAQSYEERALESVADDAVRFARDPRSIWVDGKPMFLVYRPLLIPEMPRFADYLRKRFMQAGFPGVHLVYVESMESFHDRVAPSDIGFDACVEFPPHGIAAPWTSALPNPREGWNGYVYDYVGTVENALNREGVAYSRYPCVFPSWDNTPRQALGATIVHDASPEVFQAYVEGKLDYLDRFFVGDKRLLFVNAWNEWAEGTHLEPDHVYGHRWLESVRRALVARGALGAAREKIRV